MTTTGRLGEFHAGSFWWFTKNGRKERPGWLIADTVLGEAGELADTPAGWRRYGEYLGVLAEESPAEREKKFGAMSRGWALGTKEFRRELIRDLRQRGAELKRAGRRGEGAGERREFRTELWEERLEAVAKAAGIDLNKLGPRKSDAQKVLLAAVLKAATDVSNGWLNERLGMGTPASASQFVRRFHLEGGGEKATFRRLVTLARK